MDQVQLWTDPLARAGAEPGLLAGAGHPAGVVDLSDPVIDERTGAGPRPADLPSPACPLRASRLAETA